MKGKKVAKRGIILWNEVWDGKKGAVGMVIGNKVKNEEKKMGERESLH